MSENSGGPVYPQPCTSDGNPANTPWGFAGGGLTKLEWFAGMALAGGLEAGAMLPDVNMFLHPPSELAKRAVNIAIATLAECERRSKP